MAETADGYGNGREGSEWNTSSTHSIHDGTDARLGFLSRLSGQLLKRDERNKSKDTIQQRKLSQHKIRRNYMESTSTCYKCIVQAIN